MKVDVKKQLRSCFADVVNETGFALDPEVKSKFCADKRDPTKFYPLVLLLDSIYGNSFSYDLFGGVQHESFMSIARATITGLPFYGIPIADFGPKLEVRRLCLARSDPNLESIVKLHLSVYFRELELWVPTVGDWENLLNIELKDEYNAWSYYSVAIIYKIMNREAKMKEWIELVANKVAHPDYFKEFGVNLIELDLRELNSCN